MNTEERERGKYYQRPRRQADQTPIPVLGKWGDLVLGSKKNHPERLFGWYFRVVVSADLRRDDILNTSPPTLVSMEEWAHRVRCKKPKRGEV